MIKVNTTSIRFIFPASWNRLNVPVVVHALGIQVVGKLLDTVGLLVEKAFQS